jgi:hypothetical protein
MDDFTELTGKSGEKYQFSITLYSSTFFARPGVYVLARDIGHSQYTFCYIGHTADMSVRPFAPEKLDCFRRFGVDRIFHLEEASAEKRARMVQDLLQAYAPSCNTL